MTRRDIAARATARAATVAQQRARQLHDERVRQEEAEYLRAWPVQEPERCVPLDLRPAR